jgi:UDP-N-acetylmuramate--alanine ligase
MSAIARVLAQMGWSISGSDLKESRNTERLRQEGIVVHIGHDPANLGEPDRVVVSSAIPKSNAEYAAAVERGLPILLRAQMLGEIASQHRTVSVAGTHGKTTTTSMIALALERAGLEPTILIGGELNDIGTNGKYGRGGVLVTEADESDGTLLEIDPTWVVLTNVEHDHPDHYASYEDCEAVFARYLGQVPEDGAAIYWSDAENLVRLVERAGIRGIGYGFDEGAEVRGLGLELSGGAARFHVQVRGEDAGEVELRVPGHHNALNALGCIAMALELGVPFEEVATVLAHFTGAQRRFQRVGERADVVVVDDYAHHPTEIRATLEGARTGDWERVVAVFQPHRYTRTRAFGRQFGEAFDAADVVVLTDVYGAGEDPMPGVSVRLVLDSLLERDPKKPVAYLPRLADIPAFLGSKVRPGDLVLTMGAGDVWQVGPELLGMLSEERGGDSPARGATVPVTGA